MFTGKMPVLRGCAWYVGSGQEESAGLHEGAAVYGDGGAQEDAVDVGLAVPVGAGLAGQGAAEGDVDTGELLILQEVIDEVRQAGVGADGEFADAVTVGVVVEEVFGEVVQQGGVVAADGFADGPAGGHVHRDGRLFEASVLLAEIVAEAAVDDDAAVEGGRAGYCRR